MMTPQEQADDVRTAMTMILDGCRMLTRGRAGPPEQIAGIAFHSNTLIYHLSRVVHETTYTLEWELDAAMAEAGLNYPRYSGAYEAWTSPGVDATPAAETNHSQLVTEAV